MRDSSTGRTAREYLQILRQRRLIIIVAMVFAGSASIVHSVVSERTYTASTLLRFQSTDGDLALLGAPAASDPQPDKTAAQNALSITQLSVAVRVAQQLRTSVSPGSLLRRVTSEVDPSSNLVSVSAEASSARGAAELANAFAEQGRAAARDEARARLSAATAEIRRSLEQVRSPAERAAYANRISQLVTLASIVAPVQIVERAREPRLASSPRPVRDLLVALVLGLLLGVTAALVRHNLDSRLREPDEVARLYDLPVLGVIGESALGQSRETGSEAGLSEDDWESFRIIRSQVGLLRPGDPPKVIAVTSALAQEGKSTVASWFAHASALSGRRTLLLECDLRRPVSAERLGLAPTPGLNDYLLGDSSPADVVQVASLGGSLHPGAEGDAVEPSHGLPRSEFVCIVAGSQTSRPAEVLGSSAFGDLVREISDAYDLVVLDTAPLLPVGDTLEVLPRVDSVIVCARVGELKRDDITRTSTALAHFPDQVAGLVITGVKASGKSGYYSYYHQEPVGAGRT